MLHLKVSSGTFGVIYLFGRVVFSPHPLIRLLCFPASRWVTQEKLKTAPRLWQGWVKHWTSPRLLLRSCFLPVFGSYLSSALCLQFFASMLTYPFVLVSNIMAVNNCGWVASISVGGSLERSSRHLQHQPFPRRLAGGLPPYASVYPTWVDCWRHLSREVSQRPFVHVKDWFNRGHWSSCVSLNQWELKVWIVKKKQQQ